MKISFLAFATLCLCLHASSAQDKPQSAFPKRCNPKLLPKAARPEQPQEIEAIQSYKRAPTEKFQINSDGSISDLTLARSSGSRGIDRYVLKTIAQRKYNPRPGCPVVESKEPVLIHWSN
jgi:hypothetical protein